VLVLFFFFFFFFFLILHPTSKFQLFCGTIPWKASVFWDFNQTNAKEGLPGEKGSLSQCIGINTQVTTQKIATPNRYFSVLLHISFAVGRQFKVFQENVQSCAVPSITDGI